ncbi:MAG: TolC family protein [Acidobacteria bacterium]|nr:MAG: TolC family protein [Acidobacteriota bacterium]
MSSPDTIEIAVGRPDGGRAWVHGWAVLAAAALAGWAMAPVAASAEDDGARALPEPMAREWQPLPAESRALDLEEAVRLAISHDPNLRLRETDRDFSLGLLQEAQGQFDLVISSTVRGEYNQDALTESQLEPLREQRDMLQQDIDAGNFQADVLTQSRLVVQRLQANPDIGSLTPAELALLDPDFLTNVGLLDILIADANDPALRQQLEGLRNDAIGAEIDILTGLIDDARESAMTAQDDLTMLGDVPDIDESWFGSFNLGFDKTFRNGLRLSPDLDFTGEGSNYKGKPRDPQKGGKGIPDLYTGRIGFSLTAPLLKGRGKVSTGAFERASEIDFDASEASLLHGASETALSTAFAYWELLGAQRRLQVFDASLQRQGRLTELSRGLIEADELPAAELPRIDARMANARSSLQVARNAVQLAAIDLARTIGIELDDAADAPTAIGEFPEVAPGMDGAPPAPLVTGALSERRDLLAARLLEDSGRVLLAAAERDLAAQLDFTTDWSLGNAVDDSYSELFDDSWVGPSASAALDYARPLANNAARGFYSQQQALVAQSQISARNLERLIRSNVAEIWQSLIDTRAQLVHAEAAVEAYNRTVEDEFERFRLGSATLIDAILTEERTTDALLAQIAAQVRYAQLLARLRFETGSLVRISDGGAEIDAGSLVSLPEAAR